MPSGIDFEAAGDSVVRYFVTNYLFRGLQVAMYMTWGSFVVRKHSKVHPPPLWQTYKVLRPWALFWETTVEALQPRLKSPEASQGGSTSFGCG